LKETPSGAGRFFLAWRGLALAAVAANASGKDRFCFTENSAKSFSWN